MIQIFWYIYAAFLGTMTIAFVIHGVYKNAFVKIDLFVSAITWIGLFGFITVTQIFTNFVWQIIFFAALVWGIMFALVFRIDVRDEQHGEAIGADGKAFVFVFTALFMAPLYYALFQYAF